MIKHLWEGVVLPTPILVLVLLTGCAAKNDSALTKSELHQLVIPHIDQGDVCYYFEQYWDMSGKVIKIHYDGETILSVETKHEDSFHPYVPMLVEAIKDWETCTARMAHSFLVSEFQAEYPNGYYYYMHPTRGAFEDTPFESDEVTETTYDEWKKFLEKEKPLR